MESDQGTNPENNPEDQQQGASQAATKSYECTFCKRGFSNAQALGGHMNIHRKDKAKLKQVSSSNSTHETKQQQRVVLDIPKMPPLYSPNTIPTVNSNLEASQANIGVVSSGMVVHDTIRPPWPWFQDRHATRPIGHQDHVVGAGQQLPLFAQTPSHNVDDRNPGGEEQVHGDPSEGSLQPELDLELRLGPQDSSTANTTTRKFF